MLKTKTVTAYTQELQSGSVDKKWNRCPCNGPPATSYELVLFFNRKILTSILFPTFVFLLHMATPKTTISCPTSESTVFLFLPITSQFSTPGVGHKEEHNAMESTEWAKRTDRRATGSTPGARPAHLPGHSRSCHFAFSKWRYKAKVNFLPLKRDQ